MKKIHAHGKCFDPRDFEGLVIGGQNDADSIRFVVPRIFGDELDYASWLWAIHYENKDGQGDTVALTAQVSTENPSNLWIDWTPSQTATQVPGKLTCQVFALNVMGENARRFTFHTFPIYVDTWLNPDPITQALPSVMEQALEQMAQYNQDIHDAIDAVEEIKDTKEEVLAARDASSASAASAKESEDKAKASELNAKSSEDAAKSSEDAASLSERNAAASEDEAKKAEEQAEKSADTAMDAAATAKISEDNAIQASAEAEESALNAKSSESKSKDWAVKLGDTVDGEEYSSKHYAQEASSLVRTANEVLSSIESSTETSMAQLQEKTEELMQMRRAYQIAIGDGSSKEFTIRHNFESYDFLIQVFAEDETEPSIWQVQKMDKNTVRISFEEAPPTDGISIVMVGIDKAEIPTVAWDNVEGVIIRPEQISSDLAMTEEEITAAFNAAI